MTTNLPTQLQVASKELQQLLEQLDGNKPIEQLTVSPVTETLTKFNTQYQARKVASAAIDPDELRALIRSDLITQLNNLLALSDELARFPANQPNQINFDRADARFNHKAGTAALLTYRTGLFLTTETEKGTAPEASPAIAAETWIPLQTLKGKSVGELLRIVLRTIPVDEQLDADISDLCAALLQGAETDPDVLPTIEQSGLDRSYTGLADLAASQAFRDATGPVLAPVLNVLVDHSEIAPYDEAFRTAYDAAVQFVTAQAMATPKTAEQLAEPTTQAAGAPLITPPATPASIPTSVTPPTTPIAPTTTSIPVTTQPAAAPTAQPAVPAVDFRHPEQTPQQPATPPTSPADQTKIKPINIQ